MENLQTNHDQSGPISSGDTPSEIAQVPAEGTTVSSGTDEGLRIHEPDAGYLRGDSYPESKHFER